MNKEVILPSGAKLVITPAPFADAKALYEAVLEEAADRVKVSASQQVDFNLVKDIFAVGFSSKKISAMLKPCLGRATYNGSKISDDVFEPVECRQDYFKVVFEVASENLKPFLKGLSAELSGVVEMISQLEKNQA